MIEPCRSVQSSQRTVTARSSLEFDCFCSDFLSTACKSDNRSHPCDPAHTQTSHTILSCRFNRQQICYINADICSRTRMQIFQIPMFALTL